MLRLSGSSMAYGSEHPVYCPASGPGNLPASWDLSVLKLDLLHGIWRCNQLSVECREAAMAGSTVPGISQFRSGTSRSCAAHHPAFDPVVDWHYARKPWEGAVPRGEGSQL